ncbi:agmatine deiminase family protein [Parasphingorhabdus cellanae]|uniref:Agmatine deiminase family protein n=1 Tax=Parasphingorhabdus cellanae TaxID=2806553 RepID=A0ABX7T315_9SPHN|nr:agmatine deiminase family protein [Parasphingorhabdus cellanae]QTD55954.1 agmatine deiminase family protein [Parasphingorhabdus cellanae]
MTMRWPAEWEPHEAVWIGFPGNPKEWPEKLADAQQEVAAFANAICDHGNGERTIIVCRDHGDGDRASELVDNHVEIFIEPFGDIWLRDTGPIITVNDHRKARDFRFNGWGRKFDMAGDQDIGQRLAALIDIPTISHDWVLEGGAIDGDGAGYLVTTEQCVLNPNRNKDMSKDQVSKNLKDALNIENICWMGDGLIADHTDGHIDNLARFVAEGKVAIPKADSEDDPNSAIFEDAAHRAAAAGLEVVRIPSVGKYEVEGSIAPASYMNFYVGNIVVVVPQFGVPADDAAVVAIAELFSDRKAVGLSSRALLRGGGSFHCISQQIPQL